MSNGVSLVLSLSPRRYLLPNVFSYASALLFNLDTPNKPFHLELFSQFSLFSQEKRKMSYDHDHDGGMYMPPGSSMPDGSMNSTSTDMGMMMHMTFYWGKDVLVLFSGWPERSLGMYILALIFVFLLGFAVEVLSISPQLVGSNSMAALLIQACVYVVRMALAYMVMLSVMSFNLGVFIVAVAGHGAGFLLVKARALAAANRADSAVPSAGISSKV